MRCRSSRVPARSFAPSRVFLRNALENLPKPSLLKSELALAGPGGGIRAGGSCRCRAGTSARRAIMPVFLTASGISLKIAAISRRLQVELVTGEG